MEQVVDILGIEDYSVSQTTLDNVSLGGAGLAGTGQDRTLGVSNERLQVELT